MHGIGIGLLLAAAAVGIWAWRGRVVARGRFCRRCRFDLAGLGPDHAACPECGRDLRGPKATRRTLRRARRPGLVATAALLLAGAGSLASTAGNAGPAVLGVLPDAMVLNLHALGVDAAFTELATHRLPSPALTDGVWDRLIADALAHQADPDAAWDPRHGEVLARALLAARLTEEQLIEYVRHGCDADIEFPARLREGAKALHGHVTHQTGARNTALNSTTIPDDSPVSVMISEWVTGSGVRGPDGFDVQGGTGSGMRLSVSSVTGRSSGGFSVMVPFTDEDWARLNGRRDLTVYVNHELVAVRTSDNKELLRLPRTTERRVEVVPADQPIVRLDASPEVLAAFESPTAFRLSHLHVATDGERARRYGHSSLYAHAMHTPVAVSGRLWAIDGDRELRIGWVTLDAQPVGQSMNTVIWNLPESEPPETLDAWRAAGQVTLEIRPDPSLAERTPGIDRILGVPLRFVVPIADAPPPLAIHSTPHPDLIHGVPVPPDDPPGDTP